MECPAAIEGWRALLGAAACDARPETCARYARTTHGIAPTPCCALFPTTTEQVAEIVRIASRHRVPLYPISRGKNWGYGDAAVQRDGAAIVDLSRMNRILEINRSLAYAVLQPGVSQRQLHDALLQQAPELSMDSTGAGDEASIVGNVLERGFGHTPYGDHCRTTCAYEVVLGNGNVLRTGFAHYPNAQARHVFPYGVGPSINELFTQSNFGIVTQLTLWLAPKPEAFQCFYLLVDSEEALPRLVEALRPLRLRGVLNSAVHIGNDLRVISGQRGYPWQETGGATPLPRDVRLQLRSEAGIGAWNMTGSLSGTEEQVRGAVRQVRRALGAFGKLVFVNDAKIALAQRALKIARAVGGGKTLARKLEALVPNYGLLRGVPTNAPLRGVYWRLRNQPQILPADPLDTSAGLYWISPVLPTQGEHARRILDIVEPIFEQHGFELLTTFTLLNERSMVAVMNISYDRGEAAETARAETCYDETMRSLQEAGYLPYRVGPRGMPKLVEEADVFWNATSAFKQALDPNGIISPGRYTAER